MGKPARLIRRHLVLHASGAVHLQSDAGKLQAANNRHVPVWRADGIHISVEQWRVADDCSAARLHRYSINGHKSGTLPNLASQSIATVPRTSASDPRDNCSRAPEEISQSKLNTLTIIRNTATGPRSRNGDIFPPATVLPLCLIVRHI